MCDSLRTICISCEKQTVLSEEHNQYIAMQDNQMDVSRQTLRVQKQNKEDTYNFQEVLWRAHLGKPGKADPDKKNDLEVQEASSL